MNTPVVLNATFNNIADASRFYSKMSFIDRVGTGNEFVMIDDELMWVSVELLPDADVEANRETFKNMALVHNAESIALDFYAEDQMTVAA